MFGEALTWVARGPYRDTVEKEPHGDKFELSK
jgi:hypothetical protein